MRIAVSSYVTTIIFTKIKTHDILDNFEKFEKKNNCRVCHEIHNFVTNDFRTYGYSLITFLNPHIAYNTYRAKHRNVEIKKQQIHKATSHLSMGQRLRENKMKYFHQ